MSVVSDQSQSHGDCSAAVRGQYRDAAGIRPRFSDLMSGEIQTKNGLTHILVS